LECGWSGLCPGSAGTAWGTARMCQ
jgi:hypothetical protein